MTPDDIFPESPLGEHTAMDPTLNRALWTLPDAGIWADVHRLRAEDARLRELTAWDARVKRLKDFARRKRKDFQEARELSQQKHEDASHRLLAARATMKILAVAQDLESGEDFERRRKYLADLKWLPPQLSANQGPSGSSRTHSARHTCSLCAWTGHLARYCENPHAKCTATRAGYCVVKPHHRAYYNNLHAACLYRGRQPSLRRGEIVTRAEAQDQGDTLYLDNEVLE